MSVTVKPPRAPLWMESLGDWAWPGTGSPPEILPPAWVPASPPRLEPALATAGGAAWQPERARQRRLAAGAVISAIAALGAASAVQGPLRIERELGLRAPAPPARAQFASARPATAETTLPALSWQTTDEAGAVIDRASFHSAALHGTGSFYVYLPPGYVAPYRSGVTATRYPVLYLLHGYAQPATAFLQVGLAREMDQLIARGQIPPMIAVMIQGGRDDNNWRNHDGTDYESYVLEVQQLIDRMLPTIPSRRARAIAGDSMGGYGAMNIALGNPYRFGVVESWIGFFNGLGGELHADRPIIKRLGLHAFVYGAEADHIADPAEDPPFAAALRSAGAHAESAIYPGEHDLETVEAHLGSMLAFAGQSLAAGLAPAEPEKHVPEPGTAAAATLAHAAR